MTWTVGRRGIFTASMLSLGMSVHPAGSVVQEKIEEKEEQCKNEPVVIMRQKDLRLYSEKKRESVCVLRERERKERKKEKEQGCMDACELMLRYQIIDFCECIQMRERMIWHTRNAPADTQLRLLKTFHSLMVLSLVVSKN